MITARLYQITKNGGGALVEEWERKLSLGVRASHANISILDDVHGEI